PLEYEIKRCAVEVSARRVLMLCGSKFGVAGLMTYAGFSDFDTVVTDPTIPDSYRDAILQSGAKLLIG
ncbi:MAG: hypothetical protein PHY12_14920, partial [Eubacteriales bacterium]|nr:hypothetical protein [Eubacteriales bacterium]